MQLSRIIFIRREKYSARSLVHPLDSHHLKLAIRQLPLQFGVRGQRILLIKAVKIKMHVPIAPARPQKLPIGLQKANLHMLEVDPRSRRSLSQHDPRLS